MSADAVLLVDAGNSRVKWGVAVAGGWLDRGQLDTALAAERFAEVALGLRGQVSAALGCQVAGPRVAAGLEAAAARAGLSLRWNRACASQCGVVNGYEVPESLGADRWAALVAARHRVGGPCLVVNAGTAITIDSLDGDGRFLGGMILPGIDTMLDLMASSTAGLPRAPGYHEPFPVRTADAMTTGAIEAAAGAAQRAHERLGNHCHAHVTTVVSGGAGGRLAPLLPGRVLEVDQLVLEGLRVVAGVDP